MQINRWKKIEGRARNSGPDMSQRTQKESFRREWNAFCSFTSALSIQEAPCNWGVGFELVTLSLPRGEISGMFQWLG